MIQITNGVSLSPFRTCYSGLVEVELIVDPGASGTGDRANRTTTVMLWTIGEDPQVVEAQALSNPADLRAWLKQTAATYGAGNVVVRWTRQLRAAPHVAKLVAVCLGVELPNDLEQRVSTAHR